MIEILSQSAFASVQDLGRFSALRWGVGTAGAMDRLALLCGNILLGNADDAAGIEAQVFPFEVRFEADHGFALTGADCAATLDGVPLLPWSSGRGDGGTGPPARASPGGALARRAGLPHALPAASTCRWCSARAAPSSEERSAGTRGGCCARATGSRPARRRPPSVIAAVVPPGLALPLEADDLPAVRVLPAAEHDAFTEASLARFWAEPWKITPQSDRYGFRLAGPGLEPKAPLEVRSHGIVPGVIQVPHSGQPIVQMCDAQPSGGYPKVGTVIEADLWRLGQMPIGTRFRFLRVDWAEALAAREALEAWLADVRRVASLLRARRAA